MGAAPQQEEPGSQRGHRRLLPPPVSHLSAARRQHTASTISTQQHAAARSSLKPISTAGHIALGKQYLSAAWDKNRDQDRDLELYREPCSAALSIHESGTVRGAACCGTSCSCLRLHVMQSAAAGACLCACARRGAMRLVLVTGHLFCSRRAGTDPQPSHTGRGGRKVFEGMSEPASWGRWKQSSCHWSSECGAPEIVVNDGSWQAALVGIGLHQLVHLHCLPTLQRNACQNTVPDK